MKKAFLVADILSVAISLYCFFYALIYKLAITNQPLLVAIYLMLVVAIRNIVHLRKEL